MPTWSNVLLMMPTWLNVLIIVLAVVLVIFVVLMIAGSKLQKKANSQQAQLEAAAQTVSMLIIEKKKLRMSDANLPKVVSEQVPKYMRRAKFPIVKARVIGGASKPMNLIADAKVFDLLPVGKECKVSISGIYITEIKSVRGGAIPAPPKKKGIKGFFSKMSDKANQAMKESAKEEAESRKKKK